MTRALPGIAACLLAAAAAADDYPAASFQICSACHLADGAGVPGAFPRLARRGATIAGLDGGRAYLVTVASYGLMGTIEVDGSNFLGVMAGNSGLLSAADIAAALNYVVFVLGDGAGIEPFTAEEVSAVQDAVTEKSPAAALALRSALAAEHGDRWP